MNSFLEVLDASDPRPPDNAPRSQKKNYAERLSRNLAWLIANKLRPHFDGILPDEHGKQQESRARSSRGPKKLDVNYSTSELGLGLGLSVKTISFSDPGTNRYTKNYSRNDNELRAEAKDYHTRQPYAVLIGVLFLPFDACHDAQGTHPSSFGAAVKYFRLRANRQNPRNEEELFERFFIGLYGHLGQERGLVSFYDVLEPPPKQGRPASTLLLNLEQFIGEIVKTYDARNNPPFQWGP